ncbi:hypothetical protein PAPYR_223 [Paratrimastix pyriformis]|uniref:Uncharacterized protein n=1 Tax=Paratrimastix pyriformis TaxID=342808 RepID=A0ABQ8UV56_9EUKA|nr:hypothetical protein PAPYR_223 [Paratrimastix pyriformis]
MNFSVPIKHDGSLERVPTEFPEPLLPVETLATLVSRCCDLQSLNLAMELTGCLRESAGWVDIAFPATRAPTLRSLVADCTAGLGRCALARILERVAPSLEELTVTLEDIDWLYDILPRLSHLRALSLRGCPVDCRRLIPCAPWLAELTLGIFRQSVGTLNGLLPHLASLERLDLPCDIPTPSPNWLGCTPLADFRLLPNPSRLRSVTVAEWPQWVFSPFDLAAVAHNLAQVQVGRSTEIERYLSSGATMEEIHLAEPPDAALVSLIERMPRLRKLVGFHEPPGPLLLGRLTVLHLALPREGSDRDLCLTGAPCLREFRVRASSDVFHKRICLTLEGLPALELVDTLLFVKTLTVRQCPRLRCLEHFSAVALQADGALSSVTSLAFNSYHSDLRPATFLLPVLREMPNLVELSRVRITSDAECQALFAALPRLASVDLRSIAPATQFAAPPSLRQLTLQCQLQPVTITGAGLESVFVRGCRICAVQAPRLHDLWIVDAASLTQLTLATPLLRTLVMPVTSAFGELAEEVPLAALRTMALRVAHQTDLEPLGALLRRPFVSRLGRLAVDFRMQCPLGTLGEILAIPPPSVALDVFLLIDTPSAGSEFPALPNLRALTVRGGSDLVLHGPGAPALESIRILPRRQSCSVRVPRDTPRLTRIVGGTFAQRAVDWLRGWCPLILAAPDPTRFVAPEEPE